jgi:hypothetical protein
LISASTSPARIDSDAIGIGAPSLGDELLHVEPRADHTSAISALARVTANGRLNRRSDTSASE